MEFTGERFIPEKSESMEIETEHLQRYYSLDSAVTGKVVLDAACGEGYGAMYLANRASKVIGIDISEEAIKTAKSKYKRDNLCYYCASISDIPIEDKSIDIIISFETIEHIDSQTQYDFMGEVKRVLKDDGLLIISTPDKEIYSDLFAYKNPFHIKEFNKNEFHFFLKCYFEHIKMYYQRFEVVSLMNCGEEKNIKVINTIGKPNHNSKYLIAVCSNSEINVSMDSMVYEKDNKYIKSIQRIIDTQNEIEKLGAWGKQLDEVIKKKDEIITSQNARIEELSAWGRTLDEETVKKDEIITSQNARIEELSTWGRTLDEETVKKDEIITSQNARIEELSAWGRTLDEETVKKDEIITSQNARIEELSAWGRALDEEATKKDEKIASQNTRIEELSRKVEVLENENERLYQLIESIKTASEQVLAEHEGCLQPLLEKEIALNSIYNSRGWRYLQKLYGLEEAIIPLHSKRREALKAPYFMLKNLKLIIKHVDKENVKKLLSYVKEENPGQVLNHIKSYLNRYKPIEKMDLKIYEMNDTYERLSFTYSSSPLVSIIIPVYNQWKYTYSCLRSIYENTGGINYEIIIADDVSNDETVFINHYVENISVIRNKKNLGFLLNCNNASKHARGKYILFLNNDTNVQKDWLKYLLNLIDKDSKIGMVGSKLVYADGRLQEAGGIIWKDASGWNYGRLDDPEKPDYNYVKEVDYISGAAIMVKADLWRQIGGFDESFAPAYYEDSDLAFEVRKHGYNVMYQPKSVVVHFEGVSNGTDLNAGQKSYQVINQKKFIKKWHETLSKENFPNGESVFLARDRIADKKRILIIDHYVPNYDKDAGGKCTYMYISLFIKLGLRVTFIGDNFYPHEPYTSELEQMGVEVLHGNYYFANWGKWLKENGQYFDYAYLNRPHISIKYIDLIREYSNAKIIYFGHDLHYIRELRGYELTGDKKLLESSEEWKLKEFELFGKADVIHVVGSYEQGLLAKEFPEKPIRNIPVYFYDEIKSKEPISFSKRKNLIFVGGFGHAPNGDAVLWFAREIYPEILKKYPDIKWYVVGSNPPQDVQNLECDNIIVTGFVSDEKLAEMYDSCRMSVVPLRYGAGVKGKVIESVYNRLPLVTTSIGAEGLSLEEHAFIVADTAEDFAQQVIDSYNDFNKLAELSNNCITFIENNFTTKRAQQIIEMDIKN